ncbi:MAG: DNA translocase FtsK [Pararhodobacter sp.]|nr:DNA translocase FtsK [Pararhodobacter sp.]
MASYHSSQRQPLLDSRMQAMLRQRGKELLGMALIGLAAMLALILATYAPDDPSWMASTDAPVQNALGRVGATIASPVTIIIGRAGWGIVLALAVWGLRLMIHRGEGNIPGRAVFLPIAVAVSAVWLATLVPGAQWQMDFGLGGMFGDTILGALLTALPLTSTAGMNLLTLAFFVFAAALWAYVLGSSWRELREIALFLGVGVVLSYAGLLAVLRGGGRGLGSALLHWRARQTARRSARQDMRAGTTQGWQAQPTMHAPMHEPSPDILPDPRTPGMHGYAPQEPLMQTPEPYLAVPRRETRVLRADAAAGPGAAVNAPTHSRAGAPAHPMPHPPAEGGSRWRDAPPAPANAAAGLKEPPLRAPAAPPAAPWPSQSSYPSPSAGNPPPLAPHAPPQSATEPAPKPGLLARVSALGRRLADSDPTRHAADSDAPGNQGNAPAGADRIRLRISDAIRARQRQTPVLRATPGSATPAWPATNHAAAAPVQPRGPLFPVMPPAPNRPAPATSAMVPPAPATAAGAQAPQPVLRTQGQEPPLRSPAQTFHFAAQAQPRQVTGAMPHATPGDATGWVYEAGLPHGADSFGGDPYDDDDLPLPNAQAFQPLPAARRPIAHGPSAFAPDRGDDMAIDDDDDDDEILFIAPGDTPRPQPLPGAGPAPEAGNGHVLNRRVVQPGRTRAPQPSRRAQSEAQPSLRFAEAQPVFEPPPLALLADPDTVERYTLSDDALEENARMLESVLDDYGVRGEIVAVRPGPVVTLYELEPAPGLKASRVIGLADDIARSMSALSARVSTVPGRSVIGIELPNARREKVVLREILSCRDFGDSQMRLPIALGKDIGGESVVANLAKMPHLLIAGTTGSGKSVAINTMILSLLYRLTPDECRLIMIDPKMLELSVYDGIPHLLSPVVTDPKKAVVALKWVVGEMEERYRKMSKMGVRNIEGYNGRVREALERGEMFKRTVQTGFDDETGDPVFETEEFAPELLPFIVVIVDEMADLMMVAGKEIEACIQRLAQMARASGIHLIMATQRPSVDVITGTIKANFPTRISFQVTSKIDSRTILGEQGAEQLLGMGDMLYMAGGAKITRIHGPFVSDEEVEEVVNHLKSFGPPAYQSGVLEGPDSEREADIDAVLGLGDGSGGEDALYDQAVAIVAKDRKCSTSYIQRKLGIGYNKAARLVEQMEEQGVVSPANHVGKREVLVPEV